MASLRENYSIHGTVLVLFVGLFICADANSGIECGSFGHGCINTTHLVVCVQVANGSDVPVDPPFPCPSGTECRADSALMCEYPEVLITTTQSTGVSPSEEVDLTSTIADTNEESTTVEEQTERESTSVGNTERLEPRKTSQITEKETTTPQEEVTETEATTTLKQTTQSTPPGSTERPEPSTTTQVTEKETTTPQEEVTEMEATTTLKQTTQSTPPGSTKKPNPSSSPETDPPLEVTTSATPPEFVCPCSGQFPAPPSCTRFFICVKTLWFKKKILSTCKFGWEFSRRRHMCVPRFLSDCQKSKPAVPKFEFPDIAASSESSDTHEETNESDSDSDSDSSE